MRYLLIICTGLLITAACKKKTETPVPAVTDPQLKVTVQPVFGSQALKLDSTYVTDQNWGIQFTDIKFFVTDLKNGQHVLTDAAMFDYRTSGINFFQVEGDYANFSALTGTVGVGSTLNHSDPSAFPSSSVLNIANANDMHWTWNFGYIFIKVEARADTIPDGVPLFDHYLTYHVGTDAFTGSLNFPVISWADAGSKVHTTQFVLDMKEFIDNPSGPIDIRSEKTTHSGTGQEALTQKVLVNFMHALTAP